MALTSINDSSDSQSLAEFDADDSIEILDLSTEYFNKADGFGFSITGSRTMGVFVKTVYGGSYADKVSFFNFYS